MQVSSFGFGFRAGRCRRRIRRVGERGAAFRGPQPAQAFVARDRVEPGAELGRVTKPAELGGGDEKRILHRVGGVGGLAQHRAAVSVERYGVPVVRLSEPIRVTSHDGGDNLWVLHSPYGSWVIAFGLIGAR